MTDIAAVQRRRIEAIGRAAEVWQDPEHEPRAAAVEKTLDESNRFTEEAVAFAVNQQMHQLVERELLFEWLAGRRPADARLIGVLHPGNVPLAGLQDVIAVLIAGHRYLGSLSSKSPHLLPAFASEVERHVDELPVRFGSADDVFGKADAVVATGSDETRVWAEAECDEHDIGSSRRLLRGSGFAVAIVDGNESEEEREGLAEDILLHEGLGCRNVALVWAPAGLEPDPYLEAMAAFRSIFPAHEETPGALQMQQAFLEAVDTPHAYGEGLVFLVSKGAPEIQKPGHTRWSDYEDLADVREWLDRHRDRLQLVVVPERLKQAVPGGLQTAPPGEAQRPPIDWRPGGVDTIGFLTRL